MEIHVEEPFRNGTTFPYYQIGLGGGASVFDPPSSFWSTAPSPAGGNYRVPPAFTVNDTLPRIGNWSKPTTGLVHAFHGEYWGYWVFKVASVNATENKIMFGRGGFQEARDDRFGGAYYIANVFEELDYLNHFERVRMADRFRNHSCRQHGCDRWFQSG
jgi:hypothetical protein